MKFYSELTKKLYDSQKELQKAEIEMTKSKADRAEKAKEVTELLKAANEANKKAHQALSDFCAEYGSFKTTLTDKDVTRDSFWDLFDRFIW